jgi:hypothetical protein
VRRAALILALGFASAAWAQDGGTDVPVEEPDAEWGGFPGQTAPPPEPSRSPVQQGDLWSPAPGARPQPYIPRYGREPEPPQEPERPNRVSMLGAHPLGKWVRGQSLVLGFPLAQIRVNLGLHRLLDVGIGFDTLYGTLNEPRVSARWTPLLGEHWALALQLEAGATFYSVRAQGEGYGPRWITGRRNFNIQPGLLISYQGSHPRAARLFLQLFYLLALDTEPFQRQPLDPVPRGVAVGHNAGLKFGAELPLTSYTSLVFSLGADFHFRTGDSIVMPSAALGLVTSI